MVYQTSNVAINMTLAMIWELNFQGELFGLLYLSKKAWLPYYRKETYGLNARRQI